MILLRSLELERKNGGEREREREKEREIIWHGHEPRATCEQKELHAAAVTA